jgi:hypothetical protein
MTSCKGGKSSYGQVESKRAETRGLQLGDWRLWLSMGLPFHPIGGLHALFLTVYSTHMVDSKDFSDFSDRLEGLFHAAQEKFCGGHSMRSFVRTLG